MRSKAVQYMSVLLLLFSSASDINSGSVDNIIPGDERTINILISDESQITFELLTNYYSLDELDANRGTYAELTVPDYGFTTKTGYPQLPMTSVLIGIPSDGSVRVNIRSDEMTILGSIENIAPVPYPKTTEWNNESTPLIYIPDPVAYASSTPYPESPVSIEEYGWLRGQKYVRIGLYPFQYIAAQEIIHWHQRMIIDVLIEGTQDAISSPFLDQMLMVEMNGTYENILEEYLLNYDVARQWRAAPPVDSARVTNISGERLRVLVDQDGLYRISYGDLVSAGLENEDPRTFRMTNQGHDVAIAVVGEEDGIMNEGDYILFYGEEFRGDTMAAWYSDENYNWNSYYQQLPDGTMTLWKPQFNEIMLEKYTSDNVYWLQSNIGEAAPRIVVIDGTPEEAELVAPVYKTISHAERQLAHWEYHYTNEDTWFWQFITDMNKKTFSTVLSNIGADPFTAIVRGELVANYNDNNASPDHTVELYLNGSSLPITVISWDGRSRYRFEVSVPSSALVEGSNQLEVQIVDDVYASPWIAFDWFEIEYQRGYEAEAEELRFSRELVGDWRYQLNGFSQPDIRIFDISNPRQPIQVINPSYTYANSAYQAEFQYSNVGTAQFFVEGIAEVQAPNSISIYNPPDLRSELNGADYIIITPAEFQETVQTLATYRDNQGLRVNIIDLLDLYNEFNEGIQHPIAIKNFLEYTFMYWIPPVPTYVVLIGDGHWDLLGASPDSPPVFMPPNLGWVDSSQGEVDSSNLLATIVGDDPLPDVLIGRIPVNTNIELENAINKIIAFEQSPRSDWQLNNAFIVDNTPDIAGDFVAMANNIINDYIDDGFNPIEIFLDDYTDYGLCGTPPYPGGPSCPVVNSEIIQTHNTTGSMITTYIGHASVQNWAHERILFYHLDDPTNPLDEYYNDFDEFMNDDQLPVVLSMDCLDGYWFHPTKQPSLAELFIRTNEYGAASTFSPTGLGVGSGHYALMQGFFGAIYDNGIWELGAAALSAKISLYNAGYFREMIHTYTIFGDPALKIPNPYEILVNPLETREDGLPGEDVTYTIHISNMGSLADVFHVAVTNDQFLISSTLESVELAPSESTDVVFTVTIPFDASPGTEDLGLVEINSEGDINKKSSVLLHTTVVSRIALPFLFK